MENIEKLKEFILKQLTDTNIGSYEADGYGEDYFQDAENLDEIEEKISELSSQYSNDLIGKEQLCVMMSDIKVYWNVSPRGYYRYKSFKNEIESLSDTILDFKEIFNEYI